MTRINNGNFMIKRAIINSLSGILLLCAATGAVQAAPGVIGNDARIKTFVYSENEVYPVTSLLGYQSNIEFGLKEEIETISLGDRMGWQIIPSGRRLFIRALAENVRTNMTVVTNRHAYQFDLRAASGGSADTIYVARFFYPDEQPKAASAPVQPADIASISRPTRAAGPTHDPLAGDMNYNYTYSGPENIAPSKIYDDGAATYFKFAPGAPPPAIYMVSASGTEIPVQTHAQGPYVVVSQVGKRFSIRQGTAVVCVFNESPAP